MIMDMVIASPPSAAVTADHPVNSEARTPAFTFVPGEVAMASVVESVSAFFHATGTIVPQLIGLQFRGGRAIDSSIEFLKQPEKVPQLIERMRTRWSAVAHVRVAEKRPELLPGLPHPERRTLVLIDIHHPGAVATLTCRVNRTTRRLVPGALVRREV
jgi:hypothetical protein